MNFRVSFIALGLATTSALMAQTPTKVGVIHVQRAVLETKDGQKAAQDLQTRFEPRRKDIEGKNQEIQQAQEQFRKSQNTASEEQRATLARSIDQKQKSLQRDVEDAEAEFQQEQQKAFSELGGRIMQVIDKYARDNGYALILDVSSQQSPVLYMANGIDITAEIVKLYDTNAPAAAAPPTGAAKPPAVKPTSLAPPAAKPPAAAKP